MNFYLKKSAALSALLVLCLIMPMYGQAEQEQDDEKNVQKPLVFGFLPILSTQRLVSRFGPMVDYLSEQLGRPVRLETAPDFAEFYRRTNDKRYDLIFTAPHFYYMAQRQAGYRVVVRVGAPEMHAIIVVPTDSKLTSLQDLRNKRLATVDSLSLATVLVRNELQEAGIDPDRDITLVTTPTHNASLISAYKNITDAASLMAIPYKRTRPEIKTSLRIIARTQGTPHMPIAVASRLSDQESSIIRDSLLSLKETEEGRVLLKHLAWPGFATAVPEDYDQLEWVVKQTQIP
jgi:phosphonate transport system substrate-binding protein